MISSVLNKPITFPMPQFVVQNKLASLNEYNVAAALEAEQIEYKFRVAFWNGKRLRGGIEIDFLYGPFDDLLEVMGDYWHTGQFTAADILRTNLIETEFGKKITFIWGNESMTVLDARNALRKKLRL